MPPLQLRVRQQGRIARLCGMEVESIEAHPCVSRVPGSAFGMALVRSQIIPVMRLGEANTTLIVGRVCGEVFGIVGLQVMGLLPQSAGDDEAAAAGPDAEELLELDVESLLAEMKAQQRQISQLSEEKP